MAFTRQRYRPQQPTFAERWNGPSIDLELHLHSAVGPASQRGEAKDLGVLLVPEIFDPAKNAELLIHFVLRDEIHHGVILDIEVRTAEVQFLPRINEFRLDRGVELPAPKIGSREVKFVPGPPRQTRSFRLVNVEQR